MLRSFDTLDIFSVTCLYCRFFISSPISSVDSLFLGGRRMDVKTIGCVPSV